MFVICRLQELARKKRIPLYVCFIDLTKAYDSVGRTFLWTVLTRFGVPQNMISVIRQFHDGMRACVRLHDRVCSGWLPLKQGLRQGCVLAPLLFGIFFAAVMNVASTRFKEDKGMMDALVHLRKKWGARGRVEALITLHCRYVFFCISLRNDIFTLEWTYLFCTNKNSVPVVYEYRLNFEI